MTSFIRFPSSKIRQFLSNTVRSLLIPKCYTFYRLSAHTKAFALYRCKFTKEGPLKSSYNKSWQLFKSLLAYPLIGLSEISNKVVFQCFLWVNVHFQYCFFRGVHKEFLNLSKSSKKFTSYNLIWRKNLLFLCLFLYLNTEACGKSRRDLHC